jgi:hypothetical protein
MFDHLLYNFFEHTDAQCTKEEFSFCRLPPVLLTSKGKVQFAAARKGNEQQSFCRQALQSRYALSSEKDLSVASAVLAGLSSVF